jgi:(2Fe-2S) ferredoxin
MIWPEGIWYLKVTKEDTPQIIETYMKLEEAEKQPVETSPAPVGK